MTSLHDVVIIGGGVIGCSLLHQLTSDGFKVAMLEAEENLLSGASSGNSGIVHCGFDTTSCTIEESIVLNSQSPLQEIIQQFNVPFKKVGAIMVAWTQDQIKQLSEIKEKALKKGLSNLRLLSAAELFDLEPHLNKGLVAGLLVPDEALVDSWFLPTILAHNAKIRGAEIKTKCKVYAATHLTDGSWDVECSDGMVRGRVVVNAAGLFGDLVENICHPRMFEIKPRKGQFAVFSKDAGKLLNHIILPIPSPRTKGVLVYTSVHGHLVVGPSAEDCPQRRLPSIDDHVTKKLVQQGRQLLESLREYDVVGTFAGLRPATLQSDYHLKCDRNKNWITVGGIRSTGVTASQSIAQHVVSMILNDLHVNPGCRSGSVDPLNETNVLKEYKQSNNSFNRRRYEDCEFRCGKMYVDQSEYKITHPLTLLGHQQSEKAAKL